MARQSKGNIPLLTNRVRQGDFTIPAVGGRGLIEIDTAKNVHAVDLYLTVAGVGATYAQMTTNVGQIRVRVGGKLIFDLSALQILDLYHYYNDCNGVLVDAGVLPLRFTPYMLPLSDETQEYAIGMLSDTDRSKRNTFTIEVNMLSPVGGLTVDGCEVHLITDNMPSDSIGYHVRWLPYGSTWAAASTQVLDQIQHESNALAVLAYHVNHTAGALGRIRLVVNDEEKISDMPVDLLNQEQNEAGRTPVANYESIDFALANHSRAFLDVSRLVNERLALTWTGAPGGYNVLIQQLCKNLQ